MRKRGSVLAIQSYIRLKLLTGLRRSDLLRLQVSSCREDGIHVRTNKIGKAVIYTWTPELRAVVESAKAARPVHIAPFLFCDRRGQGSLDETTGSCSGWKSMWQRFMARVLEETKVTERFTEHDLRGQVRERCREPGTRPRHARARGRQNDRGHLSPTARASQPSSLKVNRNATAGTRAGRVSNLRSCDRTCSLALCSPDAGASEGATALCPPPSHTLFEQFCTAKSSRFGALNSTSAVE